MTELFNVELLESNRIEVTFNTTPIYTCIVSKEVAYELIIEKPNQIRHLMWKRDNDNTFAYITSDGKLCIARRFYCMLYSFPKKRKNVR
jgi:hypothetical protein